MQHHTFMLSVLWLWRHFLQSVWFRYIAPTKRTSTIRYGLDWSEWHSHHCLWYDRLLVMISFVFLEMLDCGRQASDGRKNKTNAPCVASRRGDNEPRQNTQTSTHTQLIIMRWGMGRLCLDIFTVEKFIPTHKMEIVVALCVQVKEYWLFNVCFALWRWGVFCWIVCLYCGDVWILNIIR